jgi:hypothetical protein
MGKLKMHSLNLTEANCCARSYLIISSRGATEVLSAQGEALLTASAPVVKTLRPCREGSVDFDIMQNLFIEGIM